MISIVDIHSCQICIHEQREDVPIELNGHVGSYTCDYNIRATLYQVVKIGGEMVTNGAPLIL